MPRTEVIPENTGQRSTGQQVNGSTGQQVKMLKQRAFAARYFGKRIEFHPIYSGLGHSFSQKCPRVEVKRNPKVGASQADTDSSPPRETVPKTVGAPNAFDNIAFDSPCSIV
jgi:hypothetical protein